jgi:predicted TIM-barrel fold metal-dependent hydrolase
MWLNCYGQVPLTQTLSSLIFYNLFGRFPNLKVLSAENGAEWVPQLRISMDKVRGMSRNGYWPCGQLAERPSRIFDRHVYVVAYPEDDLKAIVERTQHSDNLLMGSDYPHSEGVPEPAVFVAACKGLDTAQIRGIMYENGKRMMGEVA